MKAIFVVTWSHAYGLDLSCHASMESAKSELRAVERSEDYNENEDTVEIHETSLRGQE